MSSSSPYVLHLTVSPMGDNSYSRKLSKVFNEEWAKKYPNVRIVARDLNENIEKHLDGVTLFAGYLPEDQRTPEMQANHQHRLDLVEELVQADAVVVSTPMWNWNTPSVLKAYIDQIVVIGQLDPYTEKKLAGKSITILIASGGGYGPDSHHPESDFLTRYLLHVFSALGSTDVQFVRTEYCLAGVAPGMDALIPKKEASFESAVATTKQRVQNIHLKRFAEEKKAVAAPAPTPSPAPVSAPVAPAAPKPTTSLTIEVPPQPAYKPQQQYYETACCIMM